MKADFDDRGTLVITPESNAERMALEMWDQKNKVKPRPHSVTVEEPMFKSEGLLIKTYPAV